MARMRSAAKMKLPLRTGTTKSRLGLVAAISAARLLMRVAICSAENKTSIRCPSMLSVLIEQGLSLFHWHVQSEFAECWQVPAGQQSALKKLWFHPGAAA